MVKDILGNAAYLSKGEYPVVYVRGNHETRGEFAAHLRDYFPTDTNELYFTFRYGPVSAVVIDSGEDKADDHYEYSGLVDFESYRQQEFDWLKGWNGIRLMGFNTASHFRMIRTLLIISERTGALSLAGSAHSCWFLAIRIA